MGKFRDLWDKSKDGKQREQRSFVRYACIATLLFVLFLLLKHDNLIVWIKSAFILRSQTKQIIELRHNNDALRNSAEKLTNDRDSLETFAREKYYFSEPDEDVYILR